MEIVTMGKVLVSATIENLKDLYSVEEGRLPPTAVRRIEVHDALVDTGASVLSLPWRYIKQLGLTQVRERTARTAAGVIRIRIYSVVRLTVQGREVPTEVCEVPADCPVLIGQIPLEGLDFVVDPIGQRLIGNPDHGGEQMIELYSIFPGQISGFSGDE
jgi:predicted aspartyl protease